MRTFNLFCLACAIGISVTSSGIDSCYAQSASEKAATNTALSDLQVPKEMNEIREKRNNAVVSYENLNKKIEEDKKISFLQEINQEIDEQNALAKMLEGKGDYVNAAKCYKDIFKLVKDRRLKSFIAKENKKLKQRAAKEKILAKRTLAKSIRDMADNKRKNARLEVATKKASKKAERLREEVEKELYKRVAMLEAKLQAKAVENVPSPAVVAEVPPAPEDVDVEIEVIEQVAETEKVTQVNEDAEKQIDNAEYLIESADRYFDNMDYEKAYQIYKEALMGIENVPTPTNKNVS